MDGRKALSFIGPKNQYKNKPIYNSVGYHDHPAEPPPNFEIWQLENEVR
jgi:hypothetical protein